MDTSRNTLSNIICIVFSMTLAVLFCFSIGIRFGINNMVSRAIIAAVYCGFIVGLAFALTNLTQKIQDKIQKINFDRLFVGTIIIDALIFIVTRLLVVADIIKVKFVTSNVFELATMNTDGKVFVGGSDFNEIFASVLSVVFKMTGPTEFAICLIQFLLSAISFGLFIYSIYKIYNKFVAGIVGFVIAVSSICYKSIASDSADNLIILIFSLLLFLVSVYKEKIDNDRIKVGFSLLIGILSGVLSIYNSVFIFFIAIPVIIICDCRGESTGDRTINIFVMVTGMLLSAVAVLLLDCYLFSKTGIEGFIYSVIELFKNRFSFNLNFDILNNFIGDDIFFILMIICIIYCAMFWKHEEDIAHIVCLMAVLLVYQIIGAGISNPLTYTTILLLLLSVVAANGIKGLFDTDDLIRVYRVDDLQSSNNPSKDDTIEMKKKAENSDSTVSVLNNAEQVNASEHIEAELIEDKKEENDISAENNGSNLADDFSDNRTVISDDNNNDLNDDNNGLNDDNNELNDNNELDNVNNESVDVNNESDIDSETSLPEVNDNISETENHTDENFIQSERKYSEPEVRQSTNYGINDVDFESLFSGGNIPPKAVYKDIYTEDLDLEENELNEQTETSVEADNENDDEDFSNSDVMNTTDVDVAVSNEDDDMNTNDKKAYVDSFFGYLYNEPEASKPVEKYVSNADKFADLDLDLGIDAFDNPPSFEETTVNSIEESEAEIVAKDISKLNGDEIQINELVDKEENFDESIDAEKISDELADAVKISDELINTVDISEEAVDTFKISEETVDTFEISNELDDLQVSVEKEPVAQDYETTKVEADFFFDDASSVDSNNVVTEDLFFDENDIMHESEGMVEEVLALNDTSNNEIEIFEDTEVFEETEAFASNEDFETDELIENVADIEETEFSIEAMIQKKIDEDFSYEDALNKRIDDEEYQSTVGFSFEDAIEKKLDMEDSIKKAFEYDNASLEDTINEKITAEESAEEAIENDYVSYEKTVDKMIDIEEEINNQLDDSFSYQEAIETKIDVEMAIEDASNEKMLQEFGPEEIYDDLIIDFSGKNISDSNVVTDDNINSDINDDFNNSIDLIDSYEEIDSVNDNSPIEYEAISEDKNDINENNTVETTSYIEYEAIDVSNNESLATAAKEETLKEEIKFIENPLPVPKKPKHRDMDYDRVIPYAWMHYDVELNNKNNHYDI